MRVTRLNTTGLALIPIFRIGVWYRTPLASNLQGARGQPALTRLDRLPIAQLPPLYHTTLRSLMTRGNRVRKCAQGGEDEGGEGDPREEVEVVVGRWVAVTN